MSGLGIATGHAQPCGALKLGRRNALVQRAGRTGQRKRLVCHRDKRGLKGQARRLFGGSGARCCRRRRFTDHCQVDVVDAENRRLSRRVPLRRNGSRKSIAVLNVCPGVGEHCIATGQFAVL